MGRYKIKYPTKYTTSFRGIIIIILEVIEIVININLNITAILNRERYNTLEIEVDSLSFELVLFI